MLIVIYPKVSAIILTQSNEKVTASVLKAYDFPIMIHYRTSHFSDEMFLFFFNSTIGGLSGRLNVVECLNIYWEINDRLSE